jgi:hypothetical protein
MGFRGVRPFAQALNENGRNWTSFFYKSVTPTTVAGRFYDMSVGVGIPLVNAYAGAQAAATQFTGTGNQGIYTGPGLATGQQKYVHRFSVGSTGALAPATFYLCDYLMFYPFIDMDDTDPQTMTNTVTIPRYTDGKGVRAFLVVTTGMTASGFVTMNYTNSNGVSGRTTDVGVFFSATQGTIVNTVQRDVQALNSASPWIPLQGADDGIRSVESITCSTAMGGYCALVLVKPLLLQHVREQNTQSEKEVFRELGYPVEVKTGAYLNMLQYSGIAVAAPILRGYVEYAWG